MSDQVDVMAGSVPLQGSFDGSHMVGIPGSAIASGVVKSINGDSSAAQTIVPTDGIGLTSVGPIHTLSMLPPTDTDCYLQCPPDPLFDCDVNGGGTPNFALANKVLGARSFLDKRIFSTIALPKLDVLVVTDDPGKFLGFAVFSFDGLTKLTDGMLALGGGAGIKTINLYNPLPDPGEDYLFCFTSDSAAVAIACIQIGGFFTTPTIFTFSTSVPNQILFQAANPGVAGGFPATLGALTAPAAGDRVPIGLFHL